MSVDVIAFINLEKRFHDKQVRPVCRA